MKVAPGKPKLRGSWPPDPPVRREAPAHVGETGGGEGNGPPGKGARWFVTPPFGFHVL